MDSESKLKPPKGIRGGGGGGISPRVFLFSLLPAGYGLQLLFGATQGDYANPGLNGCVSGSVLFPRRYFIYLFCIWGGRERSPSPSVVHPSRGSLVGSLPVS